MKYFIHTVKQFKLRWTQVIFPPHDCKSVSIFFYFSIEEIKKRYDRASENHSRASNFIFFLPSIFYFLFFLYLKRSLRNNARFKLDSSLWFRTSAKHAFKLLDTTDNYEYTYLVTRLLGKLTFFYATLYLDIQYPNNRFFGPAGIKIPSIEQKFITFVDTISRL